MHVHQSLFQWVDGSWFGVLVGGLENGGTIDRINGLSFIRHLCGYTPVSDFLKITSSGTYRDKRRLIASSG
jgi:hypothetical protein